MPTYNAKDADMNVVNAAYATASKLTNDPVVLLSLFEAGMVESNFHNLDHGDRDSLGYLQQRPSMGWKNPRDIPTATKSFVSRAISNRKQHPSFTAGQLAQSVQISGFPGRYHNAEKAARELLSAAQKKGGGGLSVGDVVTAPLGLADNAFDAIAGAIHGVAAPLVPIGKISNKLFSAFLPGNIIRIVSGVAGSMCLLFGIYLLTKEVRNG